MTRKTQKYGWWKWSYLMWIFVLLSIFLYFRKKSQAKDFVAEHQTIKERGKIAKGLILEYTPRNKVNATKYSYKEPSNVYYQFDVNGKKYEKSYAFQGDIFFIPDEAKDSEMEDHYFVVVYDSIEPEKSVLLFHFPVENDSIFQFYLKQESEDKNYIKKILSKNAQES